MRLNKIFALIGLMSLLYLIPQDSYAENTAGSITLSPFIGGYKFENSQHLNHEPIFGLGLGYNFDEHLGIEGVINYLETDARSRGSYLGSNAGDVDVYMYRLDLLYHFMPRERFVPFLAAGVGGMGLKPDRNGTEHDPFVNYGAGLKYFFTDSIALRGDVRHVISFENSDANNNLYYTAGLTFYFGGNKAVEPPPAPVEAPKPVKVVEQPKDSDGDGVFDREDKCPGTPKGATVDEFGCWVIKDVKFDFDKSNIKPEFYPGLDQVVKVLKENTNMKVKVEVQGHTDSVGTQQYNQKLSERRAMSVMNYLVSKGIARNRLSASGYGFSRPVATNETEEGRAKNRRVQLDPIRE
jgi:OmpA-OmpF porin, OOP family